MQEQELIRLVKARAGLRTAGEARRALDAALGALRSALDDEDARIAARALPRGLTRALERRPSTVARTAAELYSEAQRHERVALGFAMEHAQVVLQVLARELDPEVVALLRKRLPAEVAALLEPPSPPSEAPPPHVHVRPEHRPAPLQTLSRARPGPAEPIAETRHELAHAGSVVRSAAPHAETMIETARSTRPGREDETLATTRGGERRG